MTIAHGKSDSSGGCLFAEGDVTLVNVEVSNCTAGIVTGDSTTNIGPVRGGGIYSGGPLRACEHDESHLRTVLSFLGITDVQSILIEGVGLGPEAAERAVDAAIRRASSVAGVLAAA